MLMFSLDLFYACMTTIIHTYAHNVMLREFGYQPPLDLQGLETLESTAVIVNPNEVERHTARAPPSPPPKIHVWSCLGMECVVCSLWAARRAFLAPASLAL